MLGAWLPAGVTAQAAADGPPPVRATFALIDTAGRRLGQVTAIQDPAGVSLQVHAGSLGPGLHGMHLHATGVCEPPSFATAGPHFNPAGRRHGHESPDGPHLGDLPNLMVQPDSTGRAQVRIDGVTLTAGPHSIGVPGTSLLVHAAPDDGRTDPAGNAGPRIACAVLRTAPSR